MNGYKSFIDEKVVDERLISREKVKAKRCRNNRRSSPDTQTTAQQGAAPVCLQFRSFLAALLAAGELSRWAAQFLSKSIGAILFSWFQIQYDR